MNSQKQNYCAIDVTKRSFVMGIARQKRTKTETNNTKGIKCVIEYLKEFNIHLIVIGSAGGLEISLAKELQRNGFRMVIANPQQTNYFAQLQSLAKTDPKDAKMLAAYAQLIDTFSEMISDLDIDNQSKHFSDKVELIKDIKGVGNNLIATLMSMLPELGAMSAIRFEPKFKVFYERLTSKGNTFKVTINACMHKLLTVFNAIVQHNKKWNATPHLSC